MYYIYVIKTNHTKELEGFSIFSRHPTLEDAQEHLAERERSLKIYYNGYFISNKLVEEAFDEPIYTGSSN